MKEKFEMVKLYLHDMEMAITSENQEEELVIVDDEENGIKNLVIDCEEPILVLEQMILNVPAEPRDLFKRLLQMNREIVHGAFVLDEDAGIVLFRDTLQLENLDRNELEASIHALGLALSEYGTELLSYVK
ncbi:YbjN domain-containing protein [Thermodesulfobacteriota bacterium]